MAKGETYEEFVGKFARKKTTDDCYTPQAVYDAVAGWVAKEYGIGRENFVRPFCPDGDYEQYPYKPTDVVVDNPPFSKFNRIVDFYLENGVRFFLFAPGMTLFTSAALGRDVRFVVTGTKIKYENGATVNTGFVHNLPDVYIRIAPELTHALQNARKQPTRRYEWPQNVITAGLLHKYRHVDIRIGKKSVSFIWGLRCMKKFGAKKGLFGAGFLVGDGVANMLRAKAGDAEPVKLELSEEEKEIIRGLG